jgi:hypothetical protein
MLSVLARCVEGEAERTGCFRGMVESTLLHLVDECAEVGSLGRKEQNEAEAKGAA